MWTALLASYAAVVSTSSLVLSYLSYRSGDPQLSAIATINAWPEGPALYIEIYNRGRAAATVDSILMWGHGPTPVGWSLRSINSELPLRIEPHSGKRWSQPALEITKQWISRDDRAVLTMTVRLANGKFLDLIVDTSSIADLGPDSLLGLEAEPEDYGETFEPGL